MHIYIYIYSHGRHFWIQKPVEIKHRAEHLRFKTFSPQQPLYLPILQSLIKCLTMTHYLLLSEGTLWAQMFFVFFSFLWMRICSVLQDTLPAQIVQEIALGAIGVRSDCSNHRRLIWSLRFHSVVTGHTTGSQNSERYKDFTWSLLRSQDKISCATLRKWGLIQKTTSPHREHWGSFCTPANWEGLKGSFIHQFTDQCAGIHARSSISNLTALKHVF